jgi:hypothetical protein
MASPQRSAHDRALPTRELVPRDFDRTTLKRRHCILVRSLAEAMFAHEQGPAPDRLDAITVEFDHFISPASRSTRFGLLVMLELVRFAPLLVLLRVSTFEALSLDERVLVLERMAKSSLVLLALALAACKAILSLLFFEHADELVALGYRTERHRYRRALVRTEAAG